MTLREALEVAIGNLEVPAHHEAIDRLARFLERLPELEKHEEAMRVVNGHELVDYPLWIEKIHTTIASILGEET